MNMIKETTVPRIERRKHPRFRTTGYVLINQEEEENLVIDVSLGGLRLLSLRECNPGDVFDLKIFLQNGFRLATKACVVWNSKQSPSSPDGIEIGFKFVDLSLYDMKRLGNYLNDRPGLIS